ncbi:hypothetical protein D3C78_1756770 [compost metagenome]
MGQVASRNSVHRAGQLGERAYHTADHQVGGEYGYDQNGAADDERLDNNIQRPFLN